MSNLGSFLARNLASARGKMRELRSARMRVKNVRLSEKLTQFYASHGVSPWQRRDVQDIRKAYEVKKRDLDVAHDIASSRLSDKYMKFELDYLQATHEFKEQNPGMEWSPSIVSGIFSGAFWRNMKKRALALGVKGMSYGKEGA